MDVASCLGPVVSKLFGPMQRPELGPEETKLVFKIHWQNCHWRLEKVIEKESKSRVDLDVVLYSHFTRLESITIGSVHKLYRFAHVQ